MYWQEDHDDQADQPALIDDRDLATDISPELLGDPTTSCVPSTGTPSGPMRHGGSGATSTSGSTGSASLTAFRRR